MSATNRFMTLTVALLSSAAVQASVIVNSTRIVYPQNDNEVTVRLESKNQAPVLVQAWLDSGYEQSTPDVATAPFVVIPPIFRMEPGKQQVVRLAYTGQDLPSAQEGLFWFNLLEVPSQRQGAAQSNQFQLAFRSRIKLFLRPANLPYGVEAAPGKLQWQRVATEQGQALDVFNPSPYHVTFEQIRVQVAEQQHVREPAASGVENMVIPGGRLRFALPRLTAPLNRCASVVFETLDDFGAKVRHTTEVCP
jgi:chaperone protein EcpD